MIWETSPFGSKWHNGIIGSIPCGCIECITAPVPPALIVPFNSDLEIYPFVTSHAVFEVTASEPNKCYLSIYSRRSPIQVLTKLNLA